MSWNFPAPAPLAPFGCWPYTMAIPKFYWDAESPEQRVKYLCMLYDKLMAYVDALKDNVNVDSEAIKELQDAFAKFMESGFDDYYAQQIQQWVCENMAFIVSRTMCFFSFGIDDDGHIYADIPANWQFLNIKWDMNYDSPSFGQIEMEW